MSAGFTPKTSGPMAGAAFVFALILVAASFGIQSTSPISITSSSETASVNADVLAVDPISQVAATDVSGLVPENAINAYDGPEESASQTQKCVAGYDYMVFEKKAGTSVTSPFAVCPEPGVLKMQLPHQPFKNSPFGNGDSVSGAKRFCVEGKDGKFHPNPELKWECSVVWCSPPGVSVNSKNPPLVPDNQQLADALKKQNVQCWDAKSLNPGNTVDVNSVRAQGLAQALPGLSGNERQTLIDSLTPIDKANQSILDSAYKQEIEEQRQDVNKQLDVTNEKIADLAGKCSGDTGNDCKKMQSDLQTQKIQLEAKQKALDAELDNLKKNSVSLTPCGGDPSKCNPSTVPPGQQPPGTRTPGGIYNQDVAYGRGGTQFVDPYGRYGGQPSPFGGACTTGYVCSGNTLYYQSTNSYGMYGSYNYGGSGQCLTQPIQQCPYGCQQAYGQQGGMNNTAQTLGIVSSVLSMFGGGGGQNTMINPNLSRSCATQPPQSPNGNGTDGQPCPQQPRQPDPSQCSSGQWRPTSARQNGCITGYQCVPDGSGGGNKPTAQLSCQPKVADVGMTINFSFACGNANGSTGTGFDTHGQLSGTATVPAPEIPAGQNFATFTLTCIKEGVTSSAQCQVETGKSGIIMVTNPQQVHSGETSLIGWITSGMKSCIVSSPDQQDFTARNSSNTSVNGAASTSPITQNTRIQLDCLTQGGVSRTATTTITLF